MLTLTRKIGQKVLIGDGIEIVVKEIRGNQVRLGVIAPRNLPVYREELYREIANENARAMTEINLDRLEDLSKPSSPRGSGGSTPPPTV